VAHNITKTPYEDIKKEKDGVNVPLTGDRNLRPSIETTLTP